MKPLRVLLEEPGGVTFDVPEEIMLLYGGSLGFPARALYGNFVSSLDGVVALPGIAQSSGLISGRSEADHFVMAVLRACADAVLIGAETMRAAPGSLWTPGFIYPEAASAFRELRGDLHLRAEPQLVILTASGQLDPHHPALRAGALVLTTEGTARRLRETVDEATQIVAMAEEPPLDLTAVVEHLRALGHGRILTEGGPSVIGHLIADGLLDEFFLTMSPVLAGRSAGEHRPGLIDGVELLPERGAWSSLLSVRSHEQHLFLRYGLRRDGTA